MRFFFDKNPIANLDELPARYRAKGFGSPTRSTVPLVSLLKHESETWRGIAESLGCDGNDAEVHLEYTVDPPRGRGRPSHTDLMLLDSGRAVAVEVKWTEGAYNRVGEWLGKGTDIQNRREVMTGWLELLQPCAARPLDLADFSGAVYQMVHRAASACALGRAPAMAYLQFASPQNGVPKQVARLRDDLAHLRELLGYPAGFPIRLVEVTIIPTAAFERIRDLPKGSADTAAAVRQAFLGEPLFEFPKDRLH
jgi:hypothetical protein